MNGLLKVFIATSLFAAGIPWASAGPVQNVKRQDGTPAASAPAGSSSIPAVESVPATESISTPIITSAPVTPSATDSAVIPAWTPFTGTAVFPLPAVTVIDAWMNENPEARTRSFTHATETATPTCNVLKCPLTYVDGRPIYGGSTSLPVFPSPFSENIPTPSASVPTPSDVAPPSTATEVSPSVDASVASGAESTVAPAASSPAAQEPNPTGV